MFHFNLSIINKYPVLKFRDLNHFKVSRFLKLKKKLKAEYFQYFSNGNAFLFITFFPLLEINKQTFKTIRDF